jgi:ferredoxin
MIQIVVEDKDGRQQPVEIPTGISLSLMEVLKAAGYDIAATCGGMALCATCHISILNGAEKLPPAQDMEMDMLDTLPNALPNSRLACQIRVSDQIDGLRCRILGDE